MNDFLLKNLKQEKEERVDGSMYKGNVQADLGYWVCHNGLGDWVCQNDLRYWVCHNDLVSFPDPLAFESGSVLRTP